MLLNVKDVIEILDVSQATAYRVIRELNNELKDKGYLVITGRVEESYLYERFKLDEMSKVN